MVVPYVRCYFGLVMLSLVWGLAHGTSAQVTGGDAQVEDREGEQAATATQDETLQRVPVIKKVEYAIQTSLPPNLLITAHGEVPTTGWSNVQLLRRVYVTPPSDGIWEYDLFALPPSGPAAQVITKVQASNTWKDYDQSIKGVRIYGVGKGVKEIKIGKKADK